MQERETDQISKELSPQVMDFFQYVKGLEFTEGEGEGNDSDTDPLEVGGSLLYSALRPHPKKEFTLAVLLSAGLSSWQLGYPLANTVGRLPDGDLNPLKLTATLSLLAISVVCLAWDFRKQKYFFT